ncbi:endonuclease domain-containing protein [Asticcacaulis machinosus]|uniref:DUF559 domain-containing protein n=1 Tax=Asticcacaulis machinosus TaxID=2984211 RepID=A0ABT5HID2_9CAUL|nr:DUF559 domain-containing protein [Asticcacaulis machinosus]MDC7675997.1 DUF559 domain-containing protein [Asticcacaulis machinosus]
MRADAKIVTARRLRKDMTKPEVWLWMRIRGDLGDGLRFRRQHAIGQYILDFYCAKVRLAIEVDGEIHTHAEQHVHDEIRDEWLKEQGIKTHRIIARDLLEAPDEIAQGVIALARQRLMDL